MRTIEETTFAALVFGREDEFPNLALAVADANPARNPTIEWLEQNDEGLYTVKNYTQIVRFPFTGIENRERQTTLLLTVVDQIIEYGRPQRAQPDTPPWSTCGGYRHFLGREVRDGDIVQLRALREPVLRSEDHNVATGEYYDFPRYEWLAEVSLLVIPSERRVRAAA